jgi:hypothetical protein
MFQKNVGSSSSRVKGFKQNAKTGSMGMYGRSVTSNWLVGKVNGPMSELWEWLQQKHTKQALKRGIISSAAKH